MNDCATAAQSDPSRLHILLVDNDEADATRSVEALQGRLGTHVLCTHVRSLAEAIRHLLQGRPDAVLLDLALGDASGVASLAGVRGASPGTPVVVYTRGLDDALALRALRAGAHECLDKADAPAAGLARALAFAIERQRRLTSLEAARIEAAHRATHDPLTGLANRELFLDQLERALAFGDRYVRKTGLLFVDLDGFKAINDTRGHAHGDTLLRAVATRLQECVRKSDAVARLGGDEFVVLLPDVTSRRDLAFVKEAILERLREPVETTSGDPLWVQASVGSAMSPLDGSTAKELLDAADSDMYREKYLRRKTKASAQATVSASDALVTAALSGAADIEHIPIVANSVTHKREARLRTAIDRGELEVYYQPIHDVVADRIVAVEALLRWRDPDHGLQGPTGFLSLAEDTGLIVPIGEQVLRDACRAIVQWRALGVSYDLRVAVNLSAVQLREHGFDRRVAQILAETGCPADALTLELTENSTLVDGEMAMGTLRALKALGLRLVVDDFGVGHASLTFLREAPVDGIKIDRRFVAQLMADQRDQAIVSSMVRLARGLGLDVVAEGVETAEQARRLARLQCFAQQGRHYSDAVPFSAMSAALEQRQRVGPRDNSWGTRSPRLQALTSDFR
ncbi:MAG: EAL domain-containing protein [Gemmatimonadaceae bacterium]|nr:EAL domain-containing protein [Gemmatimonadaceae bacterium]